MRDLLNTTVELSVVAYFSFSLVALSLIFWLTISDLKKSVVSCQSRRKLMRANANKTNY